MIIQETINLIEKELGMARANRYEKKIEAYTYILELLYKEIPEQPSLIAGWETKGYLGNNASLGICPLCDDGVNIQMNYCSKCGKRLGWD